MLVQRFKTEGAIEGVHYTRVGGRIYPIVRGGSDVPPEAPAPAAEPVNPLLAEYPPAAPEPVAEETPAEPVAEGGAEPGVDPETFDRSYVEELRKESAKYRTKAKPYEEAFAEYDDESREVLLSLARELISDPEAGARRMVEISKNILDDKFEDVLKDPSPRPLTAQDVDRMFSERESKAQQEAAVRAVEQEAADLGYADGTADRALLFSIANTETLGDLKAAHEKIQARNQTIIDAYLEEKRAAGEAFPTPTSAGVGAGADGGPPKDFAEAKKGLLAFLSSQPGQ